MPTLAPPAPTPVAALVDAFCAMQAEHARMLSALSSARGIDATALRALTVLDASSPNGMPSKRAAAILGLSTGAMTSLSDRMERRHLITRVPNANDRRSVILQVTQAGSEAANAIRQVYATALARAVPESRYSAAAAALTSISAAFDTAAMHTGEQ